MQTQSWLACSHPTPDHACPLTHVGRRSLADVAKLATIANAFAGFFSDTRTAKPHASFSELVHAGGLGHSTCPFLLEYVTVYPVAKMATDLLLACPALRAQGPYQEIFKAVDANEIGTYQMTAMPALLAQLEAAAAVAEAEAQAQAAARALRAAAARAAAKQAGRPHAAVRDGPAVRVRRDAASSGPRGRRALVVAGAVATAPFRAVAALGGLVGRGAMSSVRSVVVMGLVPPF